MRRDAAQNRQSILDAASAVFAERGFEATLHEVAARAGVGVGTVYRRYPNKDILIDELFADRVQSIVAAAEAAVEAPDAWQGLVDFLEWSNEQQCADLGLKALIQGSPRGRERVTTILERLGPLIGTLVARAQAEGSLRPDVEPTDIGLVQVMLGAVLDATQKRRPDVWRRALAILLDGLRMPPARPASLPVPALEEAELDLAFGSGESSASPLGAQPTELSTTARDTPPRDRRTP